jgi:hypothetical protein
MNLCRSCSTKCSIGFNFVEFGSEVQNFCCLKLPAWLLEIVLFNTRPATFTKVSALWSSTMECIEKTWSAGIKANAIILIISNTVVPRVQSLYIYIFVLSIPLCYFRILLSVYRRTQHINYCYCMGRLLKTWSFNVVKILHFNYIERPGF